MGEPDHRRQYDLFRPEYLASRGDSFGSPVKLIGIKSWFIGLFCISLLIFASVFSYVVKFSKRATISGVLVPSAGALRIVPAKPGTVAHIFVNDDDFVRAGAPIIGLDLDPINKSGERLSDVLRDNSNQELSSLLQQMQSQRQSLIDQKNELLARRAGVYQQLKSLGSDLDITKEELSLQEATLAGYVTLNSKKFISDNLLRSQKIEVLKSESQLFLIQKEENDDLSTLNEISAQISKNNADVDANAAQYRMQVAQLNDKKANISTESEIMLVAPRAGRVAALRVKEGSSVTPGVAIAIILPKGDRLEAELWAPSRAVGFIKAGDSVRLMFDTFPYQKFGAGHGIVASVDRAPVLPAELPVPLETKEALYRVRVILSAQDVFAYNHHWPLSPGMRLTADIVLESKSLAQWLFEPIMSIRRGIDK